MTIVDYYFHSPSPWAYLAGPRFNELIKRKNLQVNWKPIDLLEIFKITGQKMVKDSYKKIVGTVKKIIPAWAGYIWTFYAGVGRFF